jgi:hypothetical protein
MSRNGILRLDNIKKSRVEEKVGSLVPIWARLKFADTIDPYLRICKSLGINVEWPATMYSTPVANPKIRMLIVVRNDPINIEHIKTEIACYVDRKDIYLYDHIATNDLRPPPLITMSKKPSRLIKQYFRNDDDPEYYNLYDSD